MVQKRNMYAATTKTEAARIKKHDFIIFYVNKTGRFNCVCKAKSRWHDPTSRWPTRVTDEIDLSVIQSGTVSVRKVAPSLQFVKKSKWIGLHLHGGLGNYGRPITARDYKTIAAHMKQNSKLFA